MLQEPGEAEAYFGSIDTPSVMKMFLTGRSPAPPKIPKDFGFASWKAEGPLPPWLSEEDINYFASKFSKTGFTGGLNYYRALDLYVAKKFAFVLIFQTHTKLKMLEAKPLNTTELLCFWLQNLGAYGTVDWGTNQSTS